MNRLFAILFLFACVAETTFATELEAFAGANYTTYDDVEEANSYGVSARAKVNFYDNDKGWFANMNWRGSSILDGDLLVGYGLRSRGSWFFEAGGGVAYARIWGPGFGVLVGTGVSITSNLFISFPIIYRGGGASFLFWSPYIGYKF
jgi:hypothetical protein